MPIYAFACTACGHHFDRLQKLSDPDPAACPVCSADAVKRQLTAPSFRLSGSGWYETDFKKDGDRKRNLTEKAESASSGDPVKSEGKGEAKATDSKSTDLKSGDSKSGDSKSRDSKSGDSKSADSKGADAKPEAKPTKTEPAPAAKPAAGKP